MAPDTLKPGLYDALVTRELADRLRECAPELLPAFQPPDEGEAHTYFARHAASVLGELLRVLAKDDPNRLRLQAEICNAALAAMGGAETGAAIDNDPVRLLAEIRLAAGRAPGRPRPLVPLSTSALLVNDEESLSASAVIKREIESADDIDLICAFVNYTGVRILEQEIRALCERGSMRLITTTYMGATQRRALDALRDWGVKIKITYEQPPSNTKLHAKAWLFRRNSGADTALIGSSNLSHSALMDGLEWNVRLSSAETPQILHGIYSTFERYWGDARFEAYEPAEDAERLDRALRACGGQGGGPIPDFFLDVTARPHQVDILEALDADRSRGYSRNLIVSATGTGKTVVAALDYKRLCRNGGRPSLLFVAHRAEILQQSLKVFQTVLRDGSFGELLVAGARPEDGRHVFASIQSLHEEALSDLEPDRYHIVIVDEFHHAEAATYRRLLQHITPELLLGLTATPERTDGVNVAQFFGNRITYEMRLWDALEDQLLCPFQYFGIADTVDLSSVEWTGGKYAPAALEKAYLDHGADGAVLVLEWVRRIVADPARMRALGFCVSVQHAELMAAEFNCHGVPCAALTAHSAWDERQQAVSRLRAGEVNALFTVDLFNEGVDIPEVDTLLFLRPTESALVFLQQLGRGLRLSEGKPCATVLDFVGRQNRSFRFDMRFRAVTGLSRHRLEQEVAQGFTHLPSGCHIELDRVTRERVLQNIRAAVPTRTHELAAEYRSLSGGRADYPLASFVHEAGILLDDLYRPDRTLTTLRRRVGLIPEPEAPDERKISRGLYRLLHAVDAHRLESLARLLASDRAPDIAALDDRRINELYMLAYTLQSDFTFDGLQPAVDRIWAAPWVRREAAELCSLLAALAPPGALQPALPARADIPIYTQGVYSQDEVMAAFRMRDPSAMRQGVKFFPEASCEVLFVTLRKTETEYSPSTRYDDYPIRQDLFHWESQNTAAPDTAAGHRYIHHMAEGIRMLLFVREARSADGRTAPYYCCGPVQYESHESARPMRITWRLLTPMPHRRFQQFRTAAG